MSPRESSTSKAEAKFAKVTSKSTILRLRCSSQPNQPPLPWHKPLVPTKFSFLPSLGFTRYTRVDCAQEASTKCPQKGLSVCA